MDKPLAIWCLGLLCTSLYLMFTGNFGLCIFAFLLFYATLRIVGS